MVAIIMIISTAGLANFTFSRQKARDTQRKSDLGQITRALEIYANDLGSYPLDDDNGMIVGCGDSSTIVVCEWGDVFSIDHNGATQVYMAKLPGDPKNDANYYYVSDDGNDFMLYSTLENDNDPYCRDDLGIVADCGLECNYEVTSAGVQEGEGSGRCDTE